MAELAGSASEPLPFPLGMPIGLPAHWFSSPSHFIFVSCLMLTTRPTTLCYQVRLAFSRDKEASVCPHRVCYSRKQHSKAVRQLPTTIPRYQDTTCLRETGEVTDLRPVALDPGLLSWAPAQTSGVL